MRFSSLVRSVSLSALELISLDCSVGFEEAEDKLLLPLDANIRTVEKFRDAVVNIDSTGEAR